MRFRNNNRRALGQKLSVASDDVHTFVAEQPNAGGTEKRLSRSFESDKFLRFCSGSGLESLILDFFSKNL